MLKLKYFLLCTFFVANAPKSPNVFFYCERNFVEKKWNNDLLVSVGCQSEDNGENREKNMKSKEKFAMDFLEFDKFLYEIPEDFSMNPIIEQISQVVQSEYFEKELEKLCVVSKILLSFFIERFLDFKEGFPDDFPDDLKKNDVKLQLISSWNALNLSEKRLFFENVLSIKN